MLSMRWECSTDGLVKVNFEAVCDMPSDSLGIFAWGHCSAWAARVLWCPMIGSDCSTRHTTARLHVHMQEVKFNERPYLLDHRSRVVFKDVVDDVAPEPVGKWVQVSTAGRARMLSRTRPCVSPKDQSKNTIGLFRFDGW